MTFLDIRNLGQGAAKADGSQFVMKVSKQMDSAGNVRRLSSLADLEAAIKRHLASGDGVVIRAGPWFGDVARTLDVQLLSGEWGVL